MQNIENRCNGMIKTNPPKIGATDSGFELDTSFNVVIKNNATRIRYINGTKKKILKFFTFIVTF